MSTFRAVSLDDDAREHVGRLLTDAYDEVEPVAMRVTDNEYHESGAVPKSGSDPESGRASLGLLRRG